MKDWWINLSLRDKQMLTLGGVVVVIFLLYLLIWSPISNTVSTLRTTLQHNQATLVWMQKADKQIQSIEKNPSASRSTQTTASLLSIVQNEINQNPLAKNLTQLRQAETDSVQLSFLHVDFDQLIAWLTQLWQQQNITVIQATVKKGDSQGVVAAEVMLKQTS